MSLSLGELANIRNNMQHKLIRIFIYSAGLLLLTTSIAKLVSANGSARILQNIDPILSISFGHVFVIVGVFELIVTAVCFFSNRVGLQAGLIAWLATNFLIYRLGLFLVGYHKPCSCLGNLTDALHIPPQTANTVMKIILAYLLIGSYATLFWLWCQRKKAITTSLPRNEMA